MDHCPACGQPAGDLPPLTRPQLEAMQILVEWIDTHGVPPTVREIMVEMERAGPGDVHHLLTELSRKGWIRRTPRRHRALSILRRPPPLDFSTPEFSLAEAG